MAVFIELTLAEDIGLMDFKGGSPITVNAEYVMYVHIDSKNRTHVTMQDGYLLIVQERYDHVCRLVCGAVQHRVD